MVSFLYSDARWNDMGRRDHWSSGTYDRRTARTEDSGHRHAHQVDKLQYQRLPDRLHQVEVRARSRRCRFIRESTSRDHTPRCCKCHTYHRISKNTPHDVYSDYTSDWRPVQQSGSWSRTNERCTSRGRYAYLLSFIRSYPYINTRYNSMSVKTAISISKRQADCLLSVSQMWHTISIRLSERCAVYVDISVRRQNLSVLRSYKVHCIRCTHSCLILPPLNIITQRESYEISNHDISYCAVLIRQIVSVSISVYLYPNA